MASARPSARPGPPRTLAGPAKVRRGRVTTRIEGHALSREAEEILFACAEILTEGGEGPPGRFFGSTMITFDLVEAARHLRGLERPEVEEELFRLVAGSVRVRLRAMRIARAEVARRMPDHELGTAVVETRVRYARGRIHMDLDLEVPLVEVDREVEG